MTPIVAQARKEDQKDMRKGKLTAKEIVPHRARYEGVHQIRPRGQKRQGSVPWPDFTESHLEQTQPRPPTMKKAKISKQQGAQEPIEQEEVVSVAVNDFCIVETRKEAGKLFLAQVMEKESGQPVVLHLWVINADKKITPSYINNSTNREWWRKSKKGKKPPLGYSFYDIDTNDWRIIEADSAFTEAMQKQLSLANDTQFSFYDD
jgi:hypothetical protein